MEKFMLNITIKKTNHKELMTTTEDKDVVGTFKNDLWMKIIIILMENWMISIKREKSWSYMILVGKKVFNFVDFSMLGFGYGVFQYPRFYHQDLYQYQVLKIPYLGSFEGYPGEKFIK